MQQRRPIPCSFVPAWEEAVGYNHHLPENATKMMLRKPVPRRIPIALALLLLAWLPASSPATDFTIDRLARTGDLVPGVDGATFGAVYALQVIDGAGNVLFIAEFDDGEPRAGSFFGQPNDLELFLEWQDDAPGFDDPELLIAAYAFPPNLAKDGTIVATILVGDDPYNASTAFPATYVGSVSDLQLVYYDGGAAPDSPDGATLSDFTEPLINANGQIASWGWVILPEGEDITLISIIAGPPADLQVVAQAYGKVPGIQGATFQDGEVPSVGALSLNDLGSVGFGAKFEGAGIDSDNDLGLFVGPPGDVTLVAREGDQALGVADGLVFNYFLWEVIDLNAMGNVGFIGYLEGPGIDGTNDQGVWYGPRRAPTLVPGFMEALPAPGTDDGVLFDGFETIALDNGPRLRVSALLEGANVTVDNDEGFWQGPPEDMRLLIREGQQAWELPDGVVITFDRITDGGISYPKIVSNEPGDLLMLAPLAGPGIDETNDIAVYYRRAAEEEWDFVLGAGQEFDGLTPVSSGVAPYIASGSGANGDQTNLNDAGAFTIFLVFAEDDSTGVYRVTPLPKRRKVPDWDGDGDVDLHDFARLQACFDSASQECLDLADLDNNGVIDLEDFGWFHDAFTGPT